jgi:hypothetical protein
MKHIVIMLALASGAAQLTIRCNVVPVTMTPAAAQPVTAPSGVQIPMPQPIETETTTSQTLMPPKTASPRRLWKQKSQKPFAGGVLVTTTVVLK